METGFSWVKKGFTAEDGGMDDARVAAMLIVLAFVGVSIGMLIVSPATFTLRDFGVGAAGTATGIGAWFKLRGSN